MQQCGKMPSAQMHAEDERLKQDTGTHTSPDAPVNGMRDLPSVWTAALLAIGLLLVAHPYRGIWHDSVVYAGQAVAPLSTGILHHDLFFTFGSQAKYTLFPQLLTWSAQQFGLGDSFLWLTLMGLLGFLLASWLLLRQLLPHASQLPGLFSLVLLPASYGAWGILSYAEPFLTARSFAEPLLLGSLTACVCKRYWFALLLGGIALLLHPLQALPCSVIAWLWLVQGDRRWLHLSWLLLPALLAFLWLPEFAFLGTRMDALWFQQVWQRSLVVFYSHSSSGDWFYLLNDLFVTAVAAQVAQATLRRFLFAVIGATLLLFAASLSLADFLHLAWPAALQLWRVQWLLHWSAMAVLPWLCLGLWHHRKDQWPRLLVLASALLLGLIPASASPWFPAVALLYLIWPRIVRSAAPALAHVLALLCGLLALIYVYPQLWGILGWALPNNPLWVDAMQQPRVLLLLLWLLLLSAPWGWRHLSGPARRLTVLLLSVTLFWAATRWDQRSVLQQAFTEQPMHTNPFRAEIAANAQVLWLGNLLPAWSVLHRPNYLHQQQLSGIVFNRATSIEGYRRRDLLHVQDAQGNDCRIVVFPKEPAVACKPDDAAVRQVCLKTRGALSYIVLYYPLKMQPRGTWSPAGGTSSTYYLYACRDFTSQPIALPTDANAMQPHAKTP